MATALSDGAARLARVTFVSAKVTKTMVPAGWPAAASPRQVPVSDAVLGARANRPSLAWSPSLDFLSRDPCARHPSRPPSKGTDRSGSPLRGIAATSGGVFAQCREATSRCFLPLGGAAAGGARRGGSARTADPAVTGQDVPSRRPRARRQPPGLRTAAGGPERHLGVSSLWFLSLDKQRKKPAPSSASDPVAQ